MNYLLIDTSYYVFYRYYAIVNYLKLSTGSTPDLEDVLKNEQFLNKFTDMFEKSLLKIVKERFQYKNMGTSKDLQIIFAKDCMRCDIWRIEMFPEYKATRDNTKGNVPFDKAIFQHVNDIIIPKLKEKYTNIHDLFVDKAEADDCIAIMCECLCAQDKLNNQETKSIVVITNDNDYLQLFHLDKVNIFNLQGKALRDKMIDDCSQKSIMYKILVGDPSDNIKGIMTKSKAMKIINSYNNLINMDNKGLFDNHVIQHLAPSQQKDYEFNKTIIDFSFIPQYLKDTIRDTFYNHTVNSLSLCAWRSSNDL